jgi:hypothetical protein
MPDKQENRINALTRGRDIPISHAALDRTEALLQQAMQQHGAANQVLGELESVYLSIRGCRGYIRNTEALLVQLMEGTLPLTPGANLYGQLINRLTGNWWGEGYYTPLYVYLTYGDVTLPYTIPGKVALKHWPKAAEEAFLRKQNLEYFSILVGGGITRGRWTVSGRTSNFSTKDIGCFGH